MRRHLRLLLPLLLVQHSCGWQPPLARQQVVTQDAYQAADSTVQRIAEPFEAVSVAALAHRHRLPLAYGRGLLLLDDGAAMHAPAHGHPGNRAQLANLLAQRMIATLAAPGAPDQTAANRIEIPPPLRVSASSADATLGDTLRRLDPLLADHLATAVIIFSRAERVTRDTIRAAAGLRQRHPRLCLHLISVGDRNACFKLRDFGSCGSAVRGEDIAAPEAMAEYARRLFYGDPPDSDGDGIQDHRDLCPGTPPGERINWDGCPFDQRALDALLQGNASVDCERWPARCLGGDT